MICGSNGGDSLYGDEADDHLRAAEGNVSLATDGVTAYGGGGDDLIGGGAAADTLEGGSGDDRLLGAIPGDCGDDVMKGGGGADAFASDTTDDRILIKDFDAAEGDMLHLLGPRALSAQQIVDSHAAVAGGNIVLNLDSGAEITLRGFIDLHALASHISTGFPL